MKKIITLLVLLKVSTSFAQSNIQAWYAKGQVWIVWTQTTPQPEIYEIYSSVTPFSSVTSASLTGKIALWDWSAGAIQDQLLNPSFNWRIPTNVGGTYTLSANQGLFVFTPHNAGSLYFAVVKSGNTTVTSGTNITSSSISYSYNPTSDPVTCHLQYTTVNPAGHKINIFSMWADGRQDQWNERHDFPVMANFYKNGMPSIFFVSEALTLDTLGGKKIPATIWLHGSAENANGSLPQGRPTINLVPQKGILIAHNDDYVGYVAGVMDTQQTNSWFFGWAKNKNAYSISNAVINGDTIVNYTQKRILWINKWLINKYNVDSTRIHINGHSMGSIGATALMKAYPNKFASATIINNGCKGSYFNGGIPFQLFGDSAANNPTVLKKISGANVRIKDIFDLNSSASLNRDFPVARIFQSKNDNSGQGWNPVLVSEFIKSDSLGTGVQIFWGQREHGIDTGPAWNDHWAHGNHDTTQTIRDNVAYEESKYYSNISFPVFYNLRTDINADNLGDGTLGTIATGGNGDDWGTWGGYHDWSTKQVIDQNAFWQCTAWLNYNQVYFGDNCPDSVIKGSVAIHKPQSFTPSPSTLVYYWTKDSLTNTVLQSGTTNVLSNGIVKADNININRFPKKTIIVFSLSPIGIKELSNSIDFSVYPNPAKERVIIKIDNVLYKNPKIKIINLYGQIVSETINKIGDEYQTIDVSNLNDGMYFINIQSDKERGVQKIIILK